MNTKTEPQTLRAAHDTASGRRPAPDANLSAWLAFHQSNARMYRTVADVDRGHHHEALYWVGYETRKAGEVSARIEAEKAKHN
ncbi:AMED_5909 family protein [Amycolatopsis carbonis]|uniref:AMED_5909 family protein n=1 Tax=Amycolatopsis carbonis TaxID=715471 RepID=A0A9Y2IQD3_9PSEU|nr:AMED_5909 family protein [Amycolatopsis sp. 2-15]WIX82573.1 AMED_5909 family protein [Amycolatopsis sp. 2-15]